MRELFSLIYEIKRLDSTNISKILDFLTIVENYYFEDTKFVKCACKFGYEVSEALTDLNPADPHTFPIDGEYKSRFCVCWEKTPGEFLIFGTSYSNSGLNTLQRYYETKITKTSYLGDMQINVYVPVSMPIPTPMPMHNSI
jgi:hypothetical protein